MNLPTSNESEFPGLLALVDCDADGEIVQAEGENTATLASVLAYAKQMAGIIGASLGLETFEEVRISSKTVTAVCLPEVGVGGPGGFRGALCDQKAKIETLLTKLSS